MLISPLDGSIRVASVFGFDWGRYRHDGLDLAQLHERLKALEAHVRASCVTRGDVSCRSYGRFGRCFVGPSEPRAARA